MDVERIGRPGGPPAPRGKPSAGGQDFGMLLPGRSTGAAGSAGGPGMGAQGIGDSTAQAIGAIAASVHAAALAAAESDRKARRHGRAMLRALARLQRDLLQGDADAARAELAALCTAAPAAHDPVLRLILREIDTRAATELARNAA